MSGTCRLVGGLESVGTLTIVKKGYGKSDPEVGGVLGPGRVPTERYEITKTSNFREVHLVDPR